MMGTDIYAREYAKFYENLTPETPKAIYSQHFNENSTFQDPFNRVKGLDAIHNIFVDMYAKLYQPSFIVESVVSNETVSFIEWRFTYARDATSGTESFVGVSKVIFDKTGTVESHLDFWDAGEHVYAKIPLLGSIIRFIKRKLHA